MNILVVEDNYELNKAMSKLLSKQTSISKVESAYNGEDALHMILNNDYDMIILDLMLPKMSGLEVLKKLRESKSCGVCVVSAMSEKETMIESLKIGADDYVVKPFNGDELIARIESIYRRHNKTFIKNAYELRGLMVDFDSMTVTCRGENIILGGKLYDIFEYMVRNKNTIVTKDRLFTRVWGFDSDTIYTVTEVYISKLRKILEKYGFKNNLITIKNIGYMWDESRSGDINDNKDKE